MTPVDLLIKLQELDVEVWLDGGRLQLGAPLESLPEDVRDAIAKGETELVEFLRDAAGGAAPAAGIQPAPRDGDLPLSFAQQRLWFVLQLGLDPSAYHLMYTLHLRGALDVPALEWSLGEIVRRHEVLRTVFTTVQGEPVQVVCAPPPLALPVVDVSGAADPLAEAKRRAAAAFAEPFDAGAGPLCRFTLYQLGAQEFLLPLITLHLVSDGWSYGVLFRELSALYDARRRGEPSPLPELPVQYADYAHWQRRRYEAEFDNLRRFWVERLAHLPTLELPTDRPRPATQTFTGKRRLFRIDDAAERGLRELGAAAGATQFMTMLAAFSVLLARYSGQHDIVVGTPVANRERPETEPLIGLFLNTLVLRNDLSGDPSFRDVLARTKQMALASFQHQEMPFEQLVVELRPERDLSRNPLFQVQFNLLYDTDRPAFGDLEVDLVEPEVVTSQFDLSLILSQGGGALEYNTDLFDDATIERMQSHLLSLLDAVITDPDRSVWELPLRTPAERALLDQKNATACDYPRDRGYHQLFADRAAARPDAVAVVAGGEELTYAELDARANRLAHHLIARGAGPGVLIGISVERDAAMVPALLGIWKTGAAYVPLDPAYPNDRLAFILEDAGIELLVTQQTLRDELPEQLPELVRLDADQGAIAAQPDHDPGAAVGGGDLAYVIFTSGSTGKPKGVQIEHRALVNFLTTMAARPGLDQDDVLVAVTTISFDIAGLELWLPLLVGGRVVVAGGGQESDGRQLAALLADCGATVMQATPATWHLLLESGWPGDPQLVVLCGGEAFPRDLAEQLLARCGSVWNMYGPTETTIWSLVQRVESGDGPVPIGDPIGNTEIQLLDRNRQPVPVGVHGMLHLGGDGLARGYLNRPELTAERFIRHPLRDDQGARLYDTGDLARLRPDGSLEFLGRVDHQVKVRGFRIELGEIEHALAAHDAVKECAVVTQQKRAGDQQLVAHVVLHPGASATVSEFRKLLRQSLPDYMVPPAFVMLDELPLTPNGKIDRKALHQTQHARATAGESYEPPRTAMETFLAEVWKELLEVEQVGRNDNFFDLGGHSLLAMKVMFKVEERSGERILPMELLLQNLGQFAEMCERRGQRDGGAPAPAPAAPAERGGMLSRLRKRLGRS